MIVPYHLSGTGKGSRKGSCPFPIVKEMARQICSIWYGGSSLERDNECFL